MDNKKWYKRASTLFWFMLASLPLWYAVFSSLFIYFTKSYNMSLSDSMALIDNYSFNSMLVQIVNVLKTFTPTFMKDLFNNLFSLIDNTMAQTISLCFAWFAWVYFIELLVDFIVWLPKFAHGIMTKYGME